MKKMVSAGLGAIGFLAVSMPAMAEDGQMVYEGQTAPTCASCHDGGIANAPRLGEADDWTDRRDKGVDALVESVADGLGAMPAYGGRYDDEKLAAAVEYMLSELD